MIPPPITNTSNLKRSRYFTLAYIFCCAVFVDLSKPLLEPICRKASLVSVSYKERPPRLTNLSPACRLPHQLTHSPCVQAHGTTLEGPEHISKQFNQLRFTTIHSDHYTSREGQGQTSSASAPQSSQELSLKGGHSSLRWCICSAWESLQWAVDNLSRSDWKTLSKLTRIVFCKIISQSVIFENILVKISILQTFAIWL